MRVLRLHKNNFTGRIPEYLCKGSNLQILDVAHNNLKGHIPRCLGELNAMVNDGGYRYSAPPSFDSDENVDQVMKGVDLEYTKTWDMVFNMDLSSNQLVGEIPVELTALSLLVGLNLSNNHLSGGIPDNIGNMTELNSLDLSGNKLTGVIPPSMADLTFLSHLNLSHNNLSGQIPTGRQLQTLIDPSIYEGNKNLCGPPLPNNCSNPGEHPTTIKKKNKAAEEQINVWLLYADIICGFATGFWGVIGVLLLKKQWSKKLFKFAEDMMENIYVVVMVRVAKIKRGRDAA
ncbi:receptor-like protein EIX2 [Lactuca sativa]|uniref:receptor-like protein EIX2 n=1 Tax=Lactuca sativa TaxID=4236 RepID=UPI000CD86D9C|nr:receptor-like protein EIX2 [Lactuca sativa]